MKFDRPTTHGTHRRGLTDLKWTGRGARPRSRQGL